MRSTCLRRLLGAALAVSFAASPAVAEETESAPAPAGQLTKAPELLNFVQAPYPEKALAEGVQGEVVMLLTLEADGTVSDVQVETPAGFGFDEAAIAAARQFKFSPAEVDGVAAAVQIQYRYAFTLEKKVETVAAKTETGVLSGQLLERGTRRPLSGIQVKAGEITLFTDGEGRFVFPALPAGPVTLLIEDSQFASLEDEEQVVAGQETAVRYALERVGFGDAVTVVATRPKKEVTRRTLTIDEIRTIPGTSGDALKVVQNLPGAARVPYGMGDFILRGGGWTMAHVEGHPINRPFHFGGLRSTVNNGLIESLDIYPGNYGVDSGRANGGKVDIRIRRPATDGLHGYAEADLYDAGFLVETPLTDKLSIAVGGRRSYIDGVMAVALPDSVKEQFQVAPRYSDGQLVLDYRDGADTLQLMFFGSSDEMVMVMDEPGEGEPEARGDFQFKTSWLQSQVRWDHDFGDGVKHHASLSHLMGKDLMEMGDSISLDFYYHWFTLRDHLEVAVNDWLTVRGGTESMFLTGHFDVTAPRPPKPGETDVPLGSMDVLSTEKDTNYFGPAIWAEATLKLGDLTLIPGVRVDYVNLPDEFVTQPRLTARYQTTEGTTLKAGAGLFMEIPDVDEMDETFGNPNLKTKRSQHYSAGIEQRLAEDITLDMTAFYKAFDKLVVPEDDPEINLSNDGTGRAYGLEVLLRHELSNRFYGWIAYTLMKSERKDQPGDDYRPFESDQTHNLVVVGQYKLTPTWELGSRFRLVTGNPETPVEGSTYDSDADAYTPRDGKLYSERQDAFHQLDVRVDKHWVFQDWKLTTYLEVQNVYNRKNPEFYTYNFDFSERGTASSLPILPSFGVKGTF